MGTLTNGPVQNKPFLFKTEPSGTAQVQMVGLDDESIAAIGAASSGAGTTEERVLRTVEYVANASGAGYTSGDAIVRADVYDVTGATPSLIATIWFNATQATAISAPTQANLTFVGTKDAATQTTLAQVQAAIGNQADAEATSDTGTFSLMALTKRLNATLSYFSATEGSIADTAATSDTGSFSLIALIKRLLGKFPALGQATMASSSPVTLASDQSALSIKEAQGSTVAEMTVSASTSIATLLAASAGRRGFRIAVPSSFTGTLGLSTNNAQTLANCPIQLKGGDMWVESLAAASAWYVILDSSTATIPVQSIS